MALTMFFMVFLAGLLREIFTYVLQAISQYNVQVIMMAQQICPQAQ